MQKGGKEEVFEGCTDLFRATQKTDSSKNRVMWPHNYYGMSHCQRGGEKNVRSPPTECSSNVIQREET